MTFSIIIPVYNTAPYLRGCLDSVLTSVKELKEARNGSSAEVICVDDGSTDGSGEILDSYRPVVKVIHKANEGVSVARNVALESAVGDIVCFVDSDDEVARNWLVAYADRFGETNADVVMQPGYKWIDDGYPWAYAIKRAIALMARFPRGVVMGEDGLYAALVNPYLSSIDILATKSYNHVLRSGSAMFKSLDSAERLAYMTSLQNVALSQPGLDRRIISRKAAAGIVYWLVRPADLQCASEIRKVWTSLKAMDCALYSEAPRLFGIVYILYGVLGLKWPVKVYSQILVGLVRIRHKILRGC